MEDEEKNIPRSRKKKPASVAVKIAVGVAVAVVLGGIAGAAGYLYYTGEGEQYRTVFFPNTVVNGIDVSRKSVDEVKDLVASRMDDYVLTVIGRGAVQETITGEEVGLHYVFDGALEVYLSSQDPMDWWDHRDTTTEYQIDTMITADEEMLADRVEKLVFFDDDQIVEPKDAYLSDYIEGEGYKVIPEEDGTVLDEAKVKKAVTDAVHNLDTMVVLEDLGVYKKAAVTSDDAELNAMADKLNGYLSVTVTYQFGDSQEVLDKDTIEGWISVGEDGSIVLDEEQAAAYVKGLADKYDTLGKAKTLKTTGGGTVTITGGSYGWKIDQKKETEALCGLIESGESQTREPVYSSTARSHGENDYGTTYAELNLTAQHMYFYKDGQMVLESDFVSGSHARNHDTPTGAYFINYKQRDRVLRGERRADGSYEYESPVSYWMPFNGGIGLHDASWRGAFGGKIYLTNGSHGCVNLPVSVARELYGIISTGDPVLVYTTDGSGSSQYPGSQAKPAAETAAAPETQPAPEETQPVPEETLPAEDPNAPHPDAESQASSGPLGPLDNSGGSAGSGGPLGDPGSSSGGGPLGNTDTSSGGGPLGIAPGTESGGPLGPGGAGPLG